MAELALSHRTVVVHHPEELELAWGELKPGVGVSQAPHRVLAEQSEQKPRARAALVAHPGPGIAGKRVLTACGHAVNISSAVDDRGSYMI